MNILCLMRKDTDATIQGVLDVQKQGHAVTVVDLRNDRDYGKIVELVVSSDRVLSW